MTPYKQGAADYWSYASIDDNPYDSEKAECYEWEDGYCDARAIDNSDSEYPADHPAQPQTA